MALHHQGSPSTPSTACGRFRTSTKWTDDWALVDCQFCRRWKAAKDATDKLVAAATEPAPLPAPAPEQPVASVAPVQPDPGASLQQVEKMAVRMVGHLFRHPEHGPSWGKTAVLLLAARVLGMTSDVHLSRFTGYSRGFSMRRIRRLLHLGIWSKDKPTNYLDPEHGAVDLALDVKTAEGWLDPYTEDGHAAPAPEPTLAEQIAEAASPLTDFDPFEILEPPAGTKRGSGS